MQISHKQVIKLINLSQNTDGHTTMSLANLIQTYQQRVNQALETYLPPATQLPPRLHQAIRYAVLNGGKRVRPVLVYMTGQALAANLKVLDLPAAAVECIHAYSLVHDDLPAMDDDDLRRGKPTCHIAFDEATAILVGDALQSLAFELLSQVPDTIAPTQCVAMLQCLAVASGSRGMVGGQMLDIEAVGKPLQLEQMANMHRHKTGALIRASVELGALSAPQVSDTQRQQLDHYAQCIGLAFQIQDDVLDVESNTETLGKTQGADIAHDKPTYPALLGLAAAKKMAQDMVDEALSSLNNFDQQADPLRWMARYIIERNH